MSDPNKRDAGPRAPDYEAAAGRMLTLGAMVGGAIADVIGPDATAVAVTVIAELLFPSDTKGGDRADRKA